LSNTPLSDGWVGYRGIKHQCPIAVCGVPLTDYFAIGEVIGVLIHM